MLSTVARTTSLRSSLPRVLGSTTTRAFGLGDTLGKKEKVEEDRFMREQEKAFFEKKKAEMDEKMHAEELKEYEAVIAPAMAEAHSVLKAEGAEVDVPALEALARWKLGK